MGGGFKGKKGALFGDFAGEAGFGEEGVIERLDHESGDGDVCEVRLGAGAGPVVEGIGKAVERGGEAVIEFGEGLDFFNSGEVDLAGELVSFDDDFLFQAIHEASHVNGVLPLTEEEGAGGEIAGNGEGDSGFDFWVQVRPLFSKILEDDVSAEAEADEGEFLVAFSDGVMDDGLEVFTDARVVGSDEAIWLAGAASAIPRESIPVALLEGEGHATNVFCGGLAFEAMADDGEAFVFLW